MFGFPALIGIS